MPHIIDYTKYITVGSNYDLERVYYFLHSGFFTDVGIAEMGLKPDLQTFSKFWLHTKSGVIFAAINQDRVIGAIGGVCMPYPYNPKQRIVKESFWFVDKNHRLDSIGAQLYSKLVDWATEWGAQFLIMVNQSKFPDINAFYKKEGFEELETAWIKEL